MLWNICQDAQISRLPYASLLCWEIFDSLSLNIRIEDNLLLQSFSFFFFFFCFLEQRGKKRHDSLKLNLLFLSLFAFDSVSPCILLRMLFHQREAEIMYGLRRKGFDPLPFQSAIQGEACGGRLSFRVSSCVVIFEARVYCS